MTRQRPNKLTNVGQDGLWLWVAALAALLLLVGGWLLAYLAASMAGLGAGGPGRWLLKPGPEGRWSSTATLWLAAFAVPIALLAWTVTRVVMVALKGRQWTDSLASAMSSRRDLVELSPEAVAADTERLGSQQAGIGISLCKAVLNRQWLYGTYEWCQVWIMGPRAGKTRSVAVPQLVEHGGAAVATSNKRDIVYLTRGPRSELGRCWIFDPQHIYREGVRFWWNPLSYVTNIERAEKLAGIWLDSRSEGEMGTEDPFFGPEGRKLLRNMIMAAALGGHEVAMIARWLDNPDGAPGLPDPADILHESGYAVAAGQVESVRAKVAETRDGIYGGAQSGVGWMANPDFVQWVTRPEVGGVEFSTQDFVRSTDTIYLLSKDGKGSARALVGSLTAALWEAGRELAEENGDRVPTPVLFCLDECANIVRWGELPSLFSYSGSLGLILVVILQSRSQGYRCWGKDGFTELWSAANVAFVGRGINDDEHLSSLAHLVGDRQRRDSSVSTGPGHRSTSTSTKDERILTEADLRAMPTGRGVLLVSGVRSILGELVDLSKRRDAERVAESVEAFKQPWMVAEDEDVDANREHDGAGAAAGEVAS
ncbi:hypothetical protein CCO04_27445 [Pimelobacter sp. 30-1]|nr:hypothetical protein [Pimelobacter sp. 30-1]